MADPTGEPATVAAYRRNLPSLRVDDRNEPFLAGAERGELMIGRCEDCGTLLAPPISNCTSCLGEDIGWQRAAGTGQVYSYIEYHRAWLPVFEPLLPYNVAIVELEEGVRLLSNIVGDAPVRVGDRVEVVFERRVDGDSVPVFVSQPASGASSAAQDGGA